MSRLETYNPAYQGIVFDPKMGKAFKGYPYVVPALLHNGYLWWKKERFVWAVQQVESMVVCYGGHISVEYAWVNKGVFRRHEDAIAFARKIERVERVRHE
jgi:hypothetical protein